jgi:hypothetical protein
MCNYQGSRTLKERYTSLMLFFFLLISGEHKENTNYLHKLGQVNIVWNVTKTLSAFEPSIPGWRRRRYFIFWYSALREVVEGVKTQSRGGVASHLPQFYFSYLLLPLTFFSGSLLTTPSTLFKLICRSKY